MLDFKINGLAELDKALSTLPDKIQRNVARAALRAGAKVIAEEAGRLVPERTGRLKGTIRVTSRIAKGMPTASVKVGDAKKGVFYAHLVERGTAKHLIRGPVLLGDKWIHNVKHPGATKRPFMRPAADTMSGAAVDAFAEHMRKRLTKEGVEIPDHEPETD